MNIIHVLIKLIHQETYFEGESYPHYEIGWKKGEEFHSWSGKVILPEEVDCWKAI